MEPNFSGYVSKANLKCADGRTIMPGAFKHQDGTKVPLVYQHNHDNISQVMGFVKLTDKPDGTWGDAYLNETPSAITAKELVKHGDIDKFSIWAKNLDERGADVRSGDIQEVSLVLAGSNPGANIANVLMHSDLDEDENMMFVGFELKHADTTEPAAPAEAPAKEDDLKVQDVLDTLSDQQRGAVNVAIDAIVKEAVTEALTEAALEEPAAVQHDDIDDSSKKGSNMSRNAFDRSKQQEAGTNLPELKHSDIALLMDRAKAGSGVPSLREFVRSDHGKELMHADDYGIQDIEILFPDAQALMRTPTFVDRRQDWVKVFMSGTSHSPFSRVKTAHADITADEARARGYIKATQKVDEVFPVFKRTTGPAMIYKRQKLDRQDIIDVTDFDVVAWMKAEMRGKLDEEIARAGLFGDGRAAADPGKIPEPSGTSGDGIRSILSDDALYVGHYNVTIDVAAPTPEQLNALLDGITLAREDYLGGGNLTMFTAYKTASQLLTIRDGFEHRVYRNLSEVAGDADVNQIVRVPSTLMPDDVLAIIVDLSDYNFGTNRGGEVTLFDDFDIDFNQFKYLIETYLSGALTVPYAAQVYHAMAPVPDPPAGDDSGSGTQARKTAASDKK